MSTLYCRSDTATVNGLAACKLLDTNTTWPIGATAYDMDYGAADPAYFHAKVVKRASNGTETTIAAAGSAETTRASAGDGIQTATVSIPDTTLGATDALVVYLYAAWSSGGTDAVAAFSTAQNPGNLTAATWTIARYSETTNGDYDSTPAYANLYFGSTTYETKITGINEAGGGASTVPLFLLHPHIIAQGVRVNG